MLNFSGNPFNLTDLSRPPSQCGTSGSPVVNTSNNTTPYYYNNNTYQNYNGNYNYSYNGYYPSNTTGYNYQYGNQNLISPYATATPNYYYPQASYDSSQYSYPQTYWPIQTPTTIQPMPVFQQPPVYQQPQPAYQPPPPPPVFQQQQPYTCRQVNNYCDFSSTNSYLPGTVTNIDGGTTYFDLGTTWHGFGSGGAGDFNWYRN